MGVKCSIPSSILTDTIELMQAYSIRLEAEAAALAGLKSPEAERLARKRLKDAEAAEKLFNFYIGL